ncbi:MAG TPA: hypothetical protein VEQ34_03750, partial [Pyrinomonadaceae bacterium]|nr:hypothetical protein [Pyrinomonadaceae bacterium]
TCGYELLHFMNRSRSGQYSCQMVSAYHRNKARLKSSYVAMNAKTVCKPGATKQIIDAGHNYIF